MNICVIGTGYVGLVVGSCLSGSGNNVTCTDKDEVKIQRLKEGVIPIYEPGLTEIVRENIAANRLRFSTDVPAAAAKADAVFVAVGTPPDEDGSADLGHVLDVANTLKESLGDHFTVVVLKSTVPVGTCDKVRDVIKTARPESTFDVISNPEFLKEGHAVEDFLRPHRIIIGVDEEAGQQTGRAERTRQVMRSVYAPFNRTSDRIKFMDVRSSEMTKYAANAMLATRISFMNEVAAICEALGADVDQVRRGIGSDPRIGSKFLFPGVGFGGSCLPKDVKALVRTASDANIKTELMDSVLGVNERQKEVLVDRFIRHFEGDVAGLTAAVWGLSFKPRTDDVREAPALAAIRRLRQAGVSVRAHDPVAMENAELDLEGLDVTFCPNDYAALEGADALLIFTEWNEYRQPDMDRVKQLLKRPLIFDGRNLYIPSQMADLGFVYYSIGRTKVGGAVS